MTPADSVSARIDVVTLAVADLQRALAFYRDGLGLASEGIVGEEFVGDDEHAGGAAAMFKLQSGLLLMLYPDLAKDADISRAPQSGAFSLGQLVASREDVDAVLARAAAAGGTVTARPRERPWGIYSGYFRDPDGHLWEIIWNPRMLPDDA